MRVLTLCFLAALTLFSCKKTEYEKQTTPDGMVIAVTGLSSKTSISITATDQNGKTVLSVLNKFENTTYKTDNVNPGDKIKVHYSANIPSDQFNNGNGNLAFSYKGKSIGATGGNLGHKTGSDITLTIP